VQDITDVIGLRLITLFRNEIPKILAETLLLIKHKQNIQPIPFKIDSFEEVIIYTNAPTYDPFLTDLQNVLMQEDIQFRIAESKEGYSSVHIVTRIAGEALLREENAVEVAHNLPVEIQIRSVFEDAWGEIDHRFGYVLRAGKGEENILFNSSLVQPHLRVLKQFTDACAQYADTIYASAHTPVTVKDSSGKIASVPSDDEVLLRFSVLGIPEAFRDRYVSGRAKREAAVELLHTDKALGQAECLKVAAYFLSLHHQASTELSEQPGVKLYLFYAKMNEALCLLLTDSPQHVKSAEMMYLKLREEYPDFWLVKFRLAQAMARLGSIDESLDLFGETQAAIRKLGADYIKSKTWPDELPETDYKHMTRLLPKLRGYQYWKKAQKVNQIEEKLENLLRAHDVTKDGLYDPVEKNNIYNNLVYYAMEYLSLAKGDPNPVTKKLATSLYTGLAKMEEALRDDAKSFDVAALDTMMKAYNFLNRSDLAQKIARRILELVQSSNQGNADETLESVKIALQTVSNPVAS
jgi:ppGpp synthetase/RelA/SpoT-type nucleotidyltranferase